jgi:predicted PurR-regulated permease PerM
VYYLAVDFEEMHKKALALFPKHLRKTVRKMAQEVDILISAFVRGQFVVGFLPTLLFMVALDFVLPAEEAKFI